jgi:hypothetical protein
MLFQIPVLLPIYEISQGIFLTNYSARKFCKSDLHHFVHNKENIRRFVKNMMFKTELSISIRIIMRIQIHNTTLDVVTKTNILTAL